MSDSSFRTLNESGFPFQVAVHREVEKTTTQHGWKVKYSEHAWKSIAEDKSGFLDLVFHNRSSNTFVAVECKRPRDAEWVFLSSTGDTKSRRHANGWVSDFANGSMRHFGWETLTLDPDCPEAQFCAIRGQTTGDRITLIEKTAAELILATECLALEHKDYRRPDSNDLKVFFSLIVTTAKLTIARFDPAVISLQDGTLERENVEFKEVPLVRFRKQLGVHHSLLSLDQYQMGEDIAYVKESTVFVVQAKALTELLSNFELTPSSLRGY